MLLPASTPLLPLPLLAAAPPLMLALPAAPSLLRAVVLWWELLACLLDVPRVWMMSIWGSEGSMGQVVVWGQVKGWKRRGHALCALGEQEAEV